jgi:hypothetical protein
MKISHIKWSKEHSKKEFRMKEKILNSPKKKKIIKISYGRDDVSISISVSFLENIFSISIRFVMRRKSLSKFWTSC